MQLPSVVDDRGQAGIDAINDDKNDRKYCQKQLRKEKGHKRMQNKLWEKKKIHPEMKISYVVSQNKKNSLISQENF